MSADFSKQLRQGTGDGDVDRTIFGDDPLAPVAITATAAGAAELVRRWNANEDLAVALVHVSAKLVELSGSGVDRCSECGQLGYDGRLGFPPSAPYPHGFHHEDCELARLEVRVRAALQKARVD